ncbi:conserved hypothetical protein, partial [Ricinus communis]
AVADRQGQPDQDRAAAAHDRHVRRREGPKTRIDEPAQRHRPAADPVGLPRPGDGDEPLGHAVAEPGDHQAGGPHDQPVDGVGVDIAELAGQAGGQGQDDDADAPGERLFEHRELQVVDHRLADLFGVHEVGFPQHREVRRHGRLGDVELIAELAGAERPLAQELQHPPTGGIGEGLEHPAHDETIS